MNPVDTIITALAAGAAAGPRHGSDPAGAGAYTRLKTLILDRFGAIAPALALLEQAPDSEARRLVVREELGKSDASDDPELIGAARSLLSILDRRESAGGTAVGVELRDIRARSMTLTGVRAVAETGATGVHIAGTTLEGNLVIDGVQAQTVNLFTGGSGSADPRRGLIRVLFLAASPTDSTRLRLDEEFRSIDESLRQSRFRDAFDLHQAVAVRITDLQGLLLRYAPDMLHFSGHGNAAGEVLLEDSAGRARAVSVPALAGTFSLFKSHLRGVVLNACFSLAQAEAIAEHVDFVVGMSEAVGDRAAIAFATGFYQALGHGRDLRTAFDLGCNRIDLLVAGDSATPRLLSPRRDPGEIFLLPQ